LEWRGAEMRGDEGEIPRVSVSLNEWPFLFTAQCSVTRVFWRTGFALPRKHRQHDP